MKMNNLTLIVAAAAICALSACSKDEAPSTQTPPPTKEGHNKPNCNPQTQRDGKCPDIP